MTKISVTYNVEIVCNRDRFVSVECLINALNEGDALTFEVFGASARNVENAVIVKTKLRFFLSAPSVKALTEIRASAPSYVVDIYFYD
jgi:hypothetical protein